MYSCIIALSFTFHNALIIFFVVHSNFSIFVWIHPKNIKSCARFRCVCRCHYHVCVWRYFTTHKAYYHLFISFCIIIPSITLAASLCPLCLLKFLLHAPFRLTDLYVYMCDHNNNRNDNDVMSIIIAISFQRLNYIITILFRFLSMCIFMDI